MRDVQSRRRLVVSFGWRSIAIRGSATRAHCCCPTCQRQVVVPPTLFLPCLEGDSSAALLRVRRSQLFPYPYLLEMKPPFCLVLLGLLAIPSCSSRSISCPAVPTVLLSPLLRRWGRNQLEIFCGGHACAWYQAETFASGVVCMCPPRAFLSCSLVVFPSSSVWCVSSFFEAEKLKIQFFRGGVFLRILRLDSATRRRYCCNFCRFYEAGSQQSSFPSILEAHTLASIVF